MKKINIIKFISLVIILLSFCLAGWLIIFKKDVNFHVDIARDFLLLEQMIKTKRPTLIGGRSGGIPGMFHGPAWLYLNLPAFFVGGGNPITVGCFWLMLAGLYVSLTGWLAKKMFGKRVGWITAGLTAVNISFHIKNFLNPYGAVMVFLPFFVSIIKYLKTQRGKFLGLAWFLLGLICQFQIAFGLPLLVLTAALTVWQIYKTKKLKHALWVFIILIPLSTFIVFDLRNNFLQTRSFFNYLEQPKSEYRLTPSAFFKERLAGFLTGATVFVTQSDYKLAGLAFLFLIFFTYLGIKKNRFKLEYLLFWYFYIGFWLVTLLFKGTVWSYYYQPFLTVSLVLIVAGIKLVKNNWPVYLFILIILFSNLHITFNVFKQTKSFIGQDLNSWQFYHMMAKDIYSQTESDFGYYVFSPELFGYSPRYAMNYLDKFYQTDSFAFEKKLITFLIIVPKGDNPFVDPRFWKEEQVNIKTQADWSKTYDNGLTIEKYYLDENESAVPSDPNLLNDLHFR